MSGIEDVLKVGDEAMPILAAILGLIVKHAADHTQAFKIATIALSVLEAIGKLELAAGASEGAQVVAASRPSEG